MAFDASVLYNLNIKKTGIERKEISYTLLFDDGLRIAQSKMVSHLMRIPQRKVCIRKHLTDTSL